MRTSFAKSSAKLVICILAKAKGYQLSPPSTASSTISAALCPYSVPKKRRESRLAVREDQRSQESRSVSELLHTPKFQDL